MSIGTYPYGQAEVPYSASPTFDCAIADLFSMTLSGSIQNMNVINALPGQRLSFIFRQDNSGLHSVTWPSNFKNAVVIGILSLANTAAVQSVIYDAIEDDFYADGSGLTGLGI